MRLSTVSALLLLATSAQAWQSPAVPATTVGSRRCSSLSASGRMSWRRMSTTENGGETATTSSGVTPFVRPERVVLDDLPTLYAYDHCPFCIRVRFALGLKNIKHRLHFLANDDAATPTALIGKKLTPIFEWKTENVCMPESMDIIQLVDSDERFGPLGTFLPATGRTDIKEWQGSVRDLLRVLQRPRYVATGLMPEFQQLDSRHAFIRNHQMPPYEKAEWKSTLEFPTQLQIYAEAMAKDPADDIEELNRKLVELDDVVFSSTHCSPGGLSYDDIDLWSRLRSITIIKDIQWPKKLRAYMDNMSELGDVPLYDEMAL
jgi:glutaredoxin 2